MIKTNANNQAKYEFLTAVFIMIHVFCHVLPFQLINIYRLQSIEDEGPSFLRNVRVCYITRYTAPDYRIIESSERCISYTDK